MASGALALVPAFALAAAGALTFALRPARRLNAWLCALLLLQAASVAAYALLGEATTRADAQLYARLSVWASLPIPLVTLVVAGELRGAGRSRASDAVLALVAALTLAALVAQATAPRLFLAEVVMGPLGAAMVSGPLLYLLAGGALLAQGWAAWTLARVVERDGAVAGRAGLGLLAFALLPVYSAGFFASFLFTTATPTLPFFLARVALTLAATVLVALAVARAVRIATPRARAVVLGLLGALALVGAVDGAVAGAPALARVVPGYERSVAYLRFALGALLVLAALRFGLADAGAAERAYARRASRVALRIALAAALVGATLAIGGLGLVPVALASAGALAVLLLGDPLARPPADALTRALLLPPDDPRAVAERARTYAAALAASRDAGPDGERYLAVLRDDLGVSAAEHELLVQGIASRERPRYRPIEALGRGTTAEVELALDEVAGTRVVVKRFKGLRDPAAALREARALAAVRHPRLVPFLEVDRRDEGLYLVLAYAEGGSARQLLDREGPLPAMRAVGLASDLLEGLAALHAAGIVHCDVKPENLLLDASGRGMLGDLGSASYGFAAPDVADATLSGDAGDAGEGSLSTISPEGLRNAPATPARDVYAAGALLYRLLTGEHYVDLKDATVFEARERITLDEPRLPHARVPPAIEGVLRKALAKRPADRYASAREMREALLSAAARAHAS